MAQTSDHETVSIYRFTDDEVELLMNNSNEAVLMWSTKDGWPVGVTHAFVWSDGKIWLTFTAQRHRAAAIRRDDRVSVNVSSAGYPATSPDDLPRGAITFKGRGEFFDDDKTKHWFYTALSKKLNPTNKAGEEAFYNLLDSPLRTVLAVTPEKLIMYNAGLAERHIAGTADESELSAPLESDTSRLERERKKRGIEDA
ncbi:MAG: hypothetical protein R3228_08740 [Halioglobus sp.]|nr:hypothetical protein [Halioglobus sp.]